MYGTPHDVFEVVIFKGTTHMTLEHLTDMSTRMIYAFLMVGGIRQGTIIYQILFL